MSVAALDEKVTRDRNAPVVSESGKPAFNPRTNRLLNAPILSTLLLLAWPNVLVMVAQASTGLIETWFISRSRHRRACRHGPGFSRGDADADDLRRRHGRRYLIGDCAGAWRRTPRRRGRSRSARVDHQRGARRILLGRDAGVRPPDLSSARRSGRRTRRSVALFKHRIRGQRAAVDHERTRERDPRHRQHAGAGIGDLRRCRFAGTAVALFDLRHRAVSGSRNCGRWHGRRAVLRGRDRGHGLVHPIRAQCRGIAFLAAALAFVSHHPGGRLFQFDQLGPDQRDHRIRNRVGCERGRRRTRSRDLGQVRGSNICWCRSCSGSARRWWRWSGPTSAPVSANAHSVSP